MDSLTSVEHSGSTAVDMHGVTQVSENPTECQCCNCLNYIQVDYNFYIKAYAAYPNGTSTAISTAITGPFTGTVYGPANNGTFAERGVSIPIDTILFYPSLLDAANAPGALFSGMSSGTTNTFVELPIFNFIHQKCVPINMLGLDNSEAPFWTAYGEAANVSLTIGPFDYIVNSVTSSTSPAFVVSAVNGFTGKFADHDSSGNPISTDGRFDVTGLWAGGLTNSPQIQNQLTTALTPVTFTFADVNPLATLTGYASAELGFSMYGAFTVSPLCVLPAGESTIYTDPCLNQTFQPTTPCVQKCIELGAGPTTFTAPCDGEVIIIYNDVTGAFSDNYGNFNVTFDGTTYDLLGNNAGGISIPVFNGMSYTCTASGDIDNGGTGSTHWNGGPNGVPGTASPSNTGYVCPEADYGSLALIFIPGVYTPTTGVPCTLYKINIPAASSYTANLAGTGSDSNQYYLEFTVQTINLVMGSSSSQLLGGPFNGTATQNPGSTAIPVSISIELNYDTGLGDWVLTFSTTIPTGITFITTGTTGSGMTSPIGDYSVATVAPC